MADPLTPEQREELEQLEARASDLCDQGRDRLYWLRWRAAGVSTWAEVRARIADAPGFRAAMAKKSAWLERVLREHKAPELESDRGSEE